MYVGKLDRELERVVVDLRCTDCPPEPAPRCADCQDTVDAAVASTLAHLRTEYPDWTDEQITARFIHVKGAAA